MSLLASLFSGLDGCLTDTPGCAHRSTASAVVALGLALDCLNYNIVITVFPFRLEELKYNHVSGLVGWLLFLYSAGLVVATPVIAMVSERLQSRRMVLVVGQLLLVASQVLLMESPAFWMMCIGRLLEGFASSVIIVAGFALICDATPEKDVGQQLGFVMVGVPLGQLLAPPVGGALYARWGYRAPFIFTILFTVLDLTARLLVHEKPPADATATTHSQPDSEKAPGPPAVTSPLSPMSPDSMFSESAEKVDVVRKVLDTEAAMAVAISASEMPAAPAQARAAKEKKALSLMQVTYKLLASTRTLVVLFSTFTGSFAFAALDVTLPLRVQAIWNLDSTKVGLIYLASLIPTLISSPLAGKLSDKFGPAWVATVLFVCGIPWFGLLTLDFSLAFFIVAFAVENFFLAATSSPLTTELAAVTRSMEGVGYAHTYGTFNIVYGLANAAGSVVGGQVYGHLSNGWDALCYIDVGVLALTLVLVLLFVGETPILRLRARR
ncbi:major facilitator superfamily domain-containing protein [Fomitopsis serialis]|uniref:major facilitator superfamily domain-containing protein n=1 Tax=Fomitopsis serialis TaxID=139415 RepID=UPI00200886B3|nr:major facilitator superfamily domain-containing protein [Neoantrodia serialis]KAH9915534.1 major facilitator superfamily domain-containing protein [Neoantrodia serialis]